MTTPGDRFKTWIDSLATSWKDRLRGWMVSWLSLGVEALLDTIGKRMAPKIKPILDKIEANTKITPELKPIWDEMKEPKGEVAVFFANRVGGSLVSGAIGSLSDWLLRPILAGLSYNPTFHLPKPEILIGEYFRGFITKAYLYDLMRFHGIDPAHVDDMLKISELRLPSEIVGPAALRDKAKYEKFWDDVYIVAGIEKKPGVEDERIALLKEMVYRIPGSQDVIRYAVKEAYSPEIYKAFGQDLEFPELALPDAEAAGVRKDYLLKEWIAHWVLPSTSQGFDLLHRGEINPDELDKLLKALDIMPFWRKKLTALSWDLPNRVEMRMLARYGLVDKPFIIEVLKKIGLDPDYRDLIADLMLAQGMMTDLRTRYANKWINSVEVKAEITTAGLSKDVGDRLYTWIVKNAGPDRTAPEKDLTTAEIIKGVKKNILTWDEGSKQLIELGYDEIEADYKLALEVEVAEAVPTTEINTRVDTIRRRRRMRSISRDEQIAALLDLRLDMGLATAYADNDDLRLVKETTA